MKVCILLTILIANTANQCINQNYTISPGLIREVYNNSTTVFSIEALKRNPKYPLSPDSYGTINIFDAPQNVGDYYGQRIRGWFIAPETGNYTFYSSCDDFCELYLSNDTDPKNKVLIINQPSYSTYRDFFKYPYQSSRNVSLNGTVKYYIEALMLEHTVNDHLSIGVYTPSASSVLVIPSTLLSPLRIETCPSDGYSMSVLEICIHENNVYAICTCKYGQKIIDGLIVCHNMSEIIQDSIFIKDEIPLIGNTYVATLRNLYNIYTVSFDVKPTAFYDFWTNVIHLTNDVHFHFYGGNNLAVMFSFLSKGSLGIWSTINSTIFYKKQLPLMEWSSINISQVLVNESYIYSVFLNGTVVFSSANMASVTLSNVKVYTADPWYAAQSGFIRNLIVNTHVALSEWSVWSSCNTSCGMSTMVRTRICSTTATNCTSVERINCSVLCVVNWNEWADWVTCNLSAGIKFMNRSRVCSSKNIFEWCPGSSTETIECFENNTCDSLFVSTQMDIRVDRTLKVFKNLFKEFSVSFEVNPSHSNNLTNDWLNILHLTLGKNIERYGDRVPGIWLNPTSGTLYISSAVQGEIDYSVTIESLNLFAQWTNVTVLQELVNGNYWFEIYVNGTLNYSVQNTDAREFHAITVFVSDPWHLSLPGFIRNLRILTGINGTRSEWGEWSSCSTKCGIGFIRRTQVFCMSNMEDISETMSCFSNESCQANWAKWSDWSNCNESFGIGLNNRSRICNKTSSYEWCSGNSTEVLVCFNDETCKGIWSQWSNWSQCNVACGIGSIIRVRDCNSTNLCCYGSKSETIDCYNNCQGEWTAWSDCTQTCGFNSYKVSYLWNWLVAPIEYKRVENCILQDCPVDGMWGAWENYGPCSKTCGSDGLRSRKRYCNNPPPANNGDYCKGLNETLEDCEMDTICPVNGGWSEWSFWSLCSQPCLNSERRRVRECMNSTPRYGGRYCEGNDTEIIRCPLKICKSALLSMQMILTNEDFKEQYSNLSSEVSVKFKERIKRTMTNFYGMRNKMLHLDFTFHSITNGSGY